MKVSRGRERRREEVGNENEERQGTKMSQSIG